MHSAVALQNNQKASSTIGQSSARYSDLLTALTFVFHRQPPKTAFSRPNTQSFTQGHAFPLGSRPATSSAAYYPPSATLGQAGGYGPTFTSSAESLRRMSGATASSLSVLSSAPSYGSPTSSLFAFTPPMEPVVRVANLATTLASTTLQQTFCTFSHETVFSEGMPLHVAAAAVQRQARCGQETIAQSVGLALLGDRQSSMTDSDALVLFYYDQFRRGRVGSELLMAACLKVGQLPPSPERDRRSVALSLLAAVSVSN